MKQFPTELSGHLNDLGASSCDLSAGGYSPTQLRNV